MGLFNTLKNKVDDLNQHPTDTYELVCFENLYGKITKRKTVNKNGKHLTFYLPFLSGKEKQIAKHFITKNL